MTEPIFKMRIVLLMQWYFFNRNFKIKIDQQTLRFKRHLSVRFAIPHTNLLF